MKKPLPPVEDCVDVNENKINYIITFVLERMNADYRKIKDHPLARKIDFILLPSERAELAKAISNSKSILRWKEKDNG